MLQLVWDPSAAASSWTLAPGCCFGVLSSTHSLPSCCKLLFVKPSLERVCNLHIPSSLKLIIMEVLKDILSLRFRHIWYAAQSLSFPSTGVTYASSRIWAHSGMGSVWLKIASLCIMSAIHKSLYVYFGLMNLKYAWVLKDSFYSF